MCIMSRDRPYSSWGGNNGGMSMNECEQLHPLLRGYLDDRLTARERRMVARHLNLCASARKELDQLRGGGPKSPAVSANPPSEPLDLKVLRWVFKAPKPSARKEPETGAKKTKQGKPAALPAQPKSSSFKPILGVFLLFASLALLTHFIQNAEENGLVKDAKRWLSKNHFLGVSSSLDLVLDLTNLPHWSGDGSPVAAPAQELITDPGRFRVYWSFLQPGTELPAVDFTKNAVAAVFLGQKPGGHYELQFKRMENYSDRTVLWYDETLLTDAAVSTPGNAGPWALQLVPIPTQTPVLIQKIQ